MVAPGGACMVASGGACMVVLGGCTWLLLGGMRGCSGGACMVAPRGHAWNTMRYGDTIDERAVRILLECILVSEMKFHHYEEMTSHNFLTVQQLISTVMKYPRLRQEHLEVGSFLS